MRLAGARASDRCSSAQRRSKLSLPRAFVVASMLAASCDSTTQPATATPAAATPSTAPYLVAFDTTGVCRAQVSAAQGWQAVNLNALAAAPLVVTERREDAWAVTHPALGSTWLDTSQAQPCLVQGWTPSALPVDPARVFLHLGSAGCERVDPILGSAADVTREAYAITGVLPVLVSRDGAEPTLVEGVRLASADATQRLTLDRGDLQRCLSGEEPPALGRAYRPRATSLPVSGHFGPAPIVLAWSRVAEGAAEPTPLDLDLAAVHPRKLRKWVAGQWRREGRTVVGSNGADRVVIETAFTDAEAERTVEFRPLDASTRVEITTPQWQVSSAKKVASKAAAAWASLEAQYPARDQGAYLRAADGRARRRESDTAALALTVGVPTPQAITSATQVRVSRTARITMGFPEAFYAVASTELVPRTLAGEQPSRVSAKRSLDRQAAAATRRAVDLAQYLRPLASAEQREGLAFDAGPAAGLTLTAALAYGGAPMAMLAGLLEDRAHVLQLPAIDIALRLPREPGCRVFAAESLSSDDHAALSLEVGIARPDGFTPLYTDARALPRVAIAACWLPEDPGLVLRVTADAPFVAGVFESDVALGTVLASMQQTLHPFAPDDPLSLDATVGLPEPVDVIESAVRALENQPDEGTR